MPPEPLTLMAVHAHPDDEASTTGGVLALYAAQGVRTVLVTCTDGSCGDGPGGVKPGDAGHDRAEVARLREVELRRSCEILDIGHLELLGYRDSGMMGWAANDEPGAFWGMNVDDAARPLVDLIERYRPQVIVTYDANGFYGHPDHIMAHRITMAAAASTGIPAKVYHTAIARSGFAEFAIALREAGIEPPGVSDREEGRFATDEADAPAETPTFGTADELITTTIDVAAYASTKLESLAAHGSQADNIFFLQMGPELYARFFGVESFVRAEDRTDAPVPESDLFAGIREAVTLAGDDTAP
jgi:LmbE family N-acetylglucosaminyl deacetylase